MRDVGKLAESFYRVFCSQAGITFNGSENDDKGWDFITEFEFKNNNVIHESPICCKVQVKGTDTFGANNQIKLSNLRRMCTEQMPTFFLFVNFNKKNDAQDLCLVHVDKDFIAKVFEKIQSLNQDTTLEKLHKKKMSVKYGKKHKLAENTGTCLKEKIMEYVGDDYAKYIEKKNKDMKSVGFEQESGSFTFLADGEEQIKQLIDLSLGLIDEVKIKNFKGTMSRFGIPDKNPFIEGNDGVFSMNDLEPDKTEKIYFRISRSSGWYLFDAKYFFSPFNELVDDRLKKSRIKGDFFDVVISTEAITIEFNFSPELRMLVSEYIFALKLLNCLCNQNGTAYSRFSANGKILQEYPLNGVTTKHPIKTKDALQTMEDINFIINKIDTNEKIDISWGELFQYEQQIKELRALLSIDAEKFGFNFTSSDYPQNSVDGAVIYSSQAQIGSHYLAIVFSFIGTFKKQSDDKFKLLATNKNIEEVILEPIENKPTADVLKEACLSKKTKYGSQYLVFTQYDQLKLQN